MNKRPPPKIQIEWPAFSSVAWILCGLALLSMLALDHINWKKGEKSYVFKGAVPEKIPPRPALSLPDLVRQGLSSAGVAEEEIGPMTGAVGRPGFLIRCDADRCRSLEPLIEKEMESRSISILGKRGGEAKGRTESRWLLKKGEETLEMVFSWPAEKPMKPVTKEKPEPPAKSVRPGLVALVVDDMGNSMEALDALLDLKEPVTISILPYSSYGRETARLAHGRGLEIILHLPLESLNGHSSEYETDGLIQSGMSEAEVLRIMADDLSRIPYIRGVNNHMGSKVTADESLMRIILEPIRERRLFFLDSRTSGRSVAFDVARKMGIPSSFRNVFLDADGNGGLIKERLFELFRLARKNGQAIGICHPFRETLQTLKENFHLLDAHGLKAVPVSRLMIR